MLISAAVNPVLVGALIGGTIGLVVVIILIPIMKSRGKKVPRFSQVVTYSGDVAAMAARIEALLNSREYYPQEYKGETGIFQKGVGFATAKKFIKIGITPDGFLIEAFISVYGTESGLSGFTAAIPKSTCKKVVEEIISLIQS